MWGSGLGLGLDSGLRAGVGVGPGAWQSCAGRDDRSNSTPTLTPGDALRRSVTRIRDPSLPLPAPSPSPLLPPPPSPSPPRPPPSRPPPPPSTPPTCSRTMVSICSAARGSKIMNSSMRFMNSGWKCLRTRSITSSRISGGFLGCLFCWGRVWGWGPEVWVWGLGFWVWGLGFGVWVGLCQGIGVVFGFGLGF